MLTLVARIEYVAVLGSFVFIVVESVLRVLTLALREFHCLRAGIPIQTSPVSN